MASRTQRVVKAEAPTVTGPRARMSAWDQVAPSELAFDFTVPEPKAKTLDWSNKDRAGVKEAIIRWLEEQL